MHYREKWFVKKLKEGDSVMADKGFNIRDLLARQKVTLNIPPLCKGTNCFIVLISLDTQLLIMEGVRGVVELCRQIDVLFMSHRLFYLS